MAKVYAEFVPFQYDWSIGFNPAKHNEATEAYYKANRDKAKEMYPNDPYTGEIIRFPWADSFAQYMVLHTTRGAALIWLQSIGDGWRIQDFAERGLTKADVISQVGRKRSNS